jgi:hypothetical protein
MAHVRTWFDFEQWILQQWLILQTELFHRVVNESGEPLKCNRIRQTYHEAYDIPFLRSLVYFVATSHPVEFVDIMTHYGIDSVQSKIESILHPRIRSQLKILTRLVKNQSSCVLPGSKDHVGNQKFVTHIEGVVTRQIQEFMSTPSARFMVTHFPPENLHLSLIGTKDNLAAVSMAE